MASISMLKDKVAFVTGSTRGIGWATARLFASHGATVVLNGRSNQEAVDKRAAEIHDEFGVTCVGIAADAANFAAVRGCYATIFKEFKRLDILVNNAGIVHDALLGMISEQMVRDTFDVNTLGAISHLQEAARLMQRHKSGSIINLSSVVGCLGNQGEVVYSASKAALVGLTLSAAKELAPKNIRVNIVAPGFIKTDLTQKLPTDKASEWMRRIKMARAGEPVDVANAILYFASDLSTYVTGQILRVDGCIEL